MTIAVILGLREVGPGTGISSLVLPNHYYSELSATIDQDVRELQYSIEALSESLSSSAKVVL